MSPGLDGQLEAPGTVSSTGRVLQVELSPPHYRPTTLNTSARKRHNNSSELTQRAGVCGSLVFYQVADVVENRPAPIPSTILRTVVGRVVVANAAPERQPGFPLSCPLKFDEQRV